MIVAGRHVRDPFEGHSALGVERDREGGEEAVWSMAHHYVALAGIAATHLALDSCRQARPLEILGDEGHSAGHSIVSCERGIVVLLQDLQDEDRRARRDEEATLLV